MEFTGRNFSFTGSWTSSTPEITSNLLQSMESISEFCAFQRENYPERQPYTQMLRRYQCLSMMHFKIKCSNKIG